MARQTPNRTSSTPPNPHFSASNRGGSEMCVIHAYWEVPEGGQKTTLLHPRPAIKTSKVPPKGPSRVPSAEPLRRFSVLVGNFIRKSKSPVPAPISCFTGDDLKKHFDHHELTNKGFPSKPSIERALPGLRSKGRSNGHSGGENGRFKVLLTWSRPALYDRSLPLSLSLSNHALVKNGRPLLLLLLRGAHFTSG